MPLQFLGESAEYRAARNKLLEKEIELRRLGEAVARERRELPAGGIVGQDYVFQGQVAIGKIGEVKFSELFAPGKETVAIYSYMFGPERNQPCPMCTPLLDGLDGVAEHIRQRVNFVAVAESPADRLITFAAQRSWHHLRLLSCAGNSYNKDYWGKTPSGSDTTMLNVFHRDGETIRHFWGAEMADGPNDPGQDSRAMDLLNPIFQMFDLTPEGRGNHYTKLTYP